MDVTPIDVAPIVRFTAKSRHRRASSACPDCANNEHMRRSKRRPIRSPRRRDRIQGIRVLGRNYAFGTRLHNDVR